ncbi:shikimate kinase [Neolewinella antarctica]|uniref:Shikimate kinase n=1 Tax=Neolewinella antarctica TaxID=442734 RepID=A0ABX0XBZ0_9BACT|nr:shikimate kinase [Neolewinella antarctica]NJC26496.1 shikimate kinase [Neolewinella antarctica]
MGSGKSHTGKELATHLRLRFVDLDDEIERLAGCSVSQIFAEHGEETFRELEARALRSFAGSGVIIATGGGAPCFHDGMAYMNQTGITIFLDPSTEILIARLSDGRGHRPLLQSETNLRELVTNKLSARRPTYECAQIHLHYADPKFDVTGWLTKRLDNY